MNELTTHCSFFKYDGFHSQCKPWCYGWHTLRHPLNHFAVCAELHKRWHDMKNAGHVQVHNKHAPVMLLGQLCGDWIRVSSLNYNNWLSMAVALNFNNALSSWQLSWINPNSFWLNIHVLHVTIMVSMDRNAKHIILMTIMKWMLWLSWMNDRNKQIL